MNLTLAAVFRNQIAEVQRDVVLAIIMNSGEIRIRLADELDYPAHVEWLRRDAINRSDVWGGFSMIIESGVVSGLFPYSRLNRVDPPCLNEDEIDAIESLLPLAPTYTVYR